MENPREHLQSLVKTFTISAENVSAVVSRISGMAQAFAYNVDLCDCKEACQLLISGCSESLSAPSDALCRQKQKK